MRMWIGVEVEKLCDQHLLGEHNEIHKFKSVFLKKHSIAGRVQYPAQISPAQMEDRHLELAIEMTERGFSHKSPYSLPDLSHLTAQEQYPIVDEEYNLIDLYDRCPNCRKRIDAKSA